MSVGEARIAAIAFVMMTASVALNVFVLQPDREAVRLAANGLPEPSFTPFGRRPGGEYPGGPRPGEVAEREAVRAGKVAEAAVPKVEPPSVGSITPIANSAELTRGVQRELNARGYDAGPPDGVAGMVTRAAIMAYEYDYDLPLTAAPSQDLLGRIILGVSSPPGQRTVEARSVGPEAQKMIVTVGARLQALGYAVGPMSGRPTDQLAQSIRKFEVDQRLKETGRISGPLVSRLARLQAQGQAPAQSRTQTNGGRTAAQR